MSQVIPSDSSIQNELKLVYGSLSRLLQPRGVSIKLLNPKGDVYPILLEAAEIPEQNVLLPVVQLEISKLKLTILQKFSIYGRKVNTQSAAWNVSVQVNVSELEPEKKAFVASNVGEYSGKVPLEFFEKIKKISERVATNLENVRGKEEATKNALVLPMLQALGYDVFDPMEVRPEFLADVPEVKGEKVDYAIMKDNQPILLIECKSAGENLDKPHYKAQLHRYFTETHARFGCLTDGVIYRFFTDIEKENIMDSKPFFEFNILELQELAIAELRKFSKSIFHPNELRDNASDLKYTSEIKKIIAEQFAEPSTEFVKFFLEYGKPDSLYTGVKTQAIINKFAPIVQRSLNQFLNEWVKDKLQSVIEDRSPDGLVNSSDSISIETNPVETKNDGINTTQEEIEGFYIVKSVLSEITDPSRISYKDNLNYFSIVLDSSQMKNICRLWLNGSNKFISFKENGKDTKYSIATINDIFQYSSKIKDSLNMLLSK